MVRAVCFNRKALNLNVLNRICAQLGCEFQGYLTDASMVNCIESFPDGTVYLSYVHHVNNRMVNCQADVQKFITVNNVYGSKQNK